MRELAGADDAEGIGVASECSGAALCCDMWRRWTLRFYDTASTLVTVTRLQMWREGMCTKNMVVWCHGDWMAWYVDGGRIMPRFWACSLRGFGCGKLEEPG